MSFFLACEQAPQLGKTRKTGRDERFGLVGTVGWRIRRFPPPQLPLGHFSSRDQFFSRFPQPRSLFTGYVFPTTYVIYFLSEQNPCSRLPCMNNGTCQVGYTDKGYRCKCPWTFTGEHCDEGKWKILVFKGVFIFIFS